MISDKKLLEAVQLYAYYSVLCSKYVEHSFDSGAEAVAMAVQSLQEVK